MIRLIASAGLLAIAICFTVSGIALFRKAETTVNPTTPEAASDLVTSGIYNYTRNPMYVGFLLLLIAWGIWLSNVYALVLPAGFILYMNRFQIGPEEEALQALFGDRYADYKSRVRRWL